MTFCPSCGARLLEGARFCEHCGSAVQTQAVPVASVPPPSPAPAPVPAAVAVAGPGEGPVSPDDAEQSAEPAGRPAWTAPTGPAAPRKSRRGLLTGIGGVAAVGVLGAVGYLVYDRLDGPSGGADSPSAAVLELSAAASAEDPVTALSLLPPGEVGSLVELYGDVEAKATSAGVAAEGKPFAGFDVRLDGVAVETEELGEDVAAVTVTGGTVSWTLDPDQLQGALRIDESGDVRTAGEGAADLVEVTRSAGEGAPLRIMTVQRDGTWYVSPIYSLLELWRVNEGLPAPDFSEEIDLEDTGADSATDAVEQAAQALAAYDVDGFLDLLSPDEAAALYHYRDAVVTALYRDGELAELQSEAQLTVDAVDAEEGEEVDDRVPVTVRSASGSLSTGDDFFTWTLDRNCLSYTEDGDADGACLDEILDDSGLGSDLASEFDALTLLTHEVDGRWYLSPLATLVAEARTAVDALDADTVTALLGVPQFGTVDAQLEAGAAVEGSLDGMNDYALYEMDVPAGSVLSTCIEDAGIGGIYGPDGRPVNGSPALATDGGRYRVLVTGANSDSFSLTPEVSALEELTVPSTVPAAADGTCGERLFAVEATAGEPLLFGTDVGDDVRITTPGGESVRASAFVPTETGRHLLSVAADQEVSVEALGGDVLTVGSSVTGTVSGSESTTMRVFVEAGTEAEITVVGAGAVEPYVELFTLDGDYVDNDYPTFANTASVIPWDYPTPQIYELVVQDYFGESGSFEVRIVAN